MLKGESEDNIVEYLRPQEVTLLCMLMISVSFINRKIWRI